MLTPEFVSGYQWFRDSVPANPETVPRIVITVILEGREIPALVDTGASQCVVSWTVAEALATVEDCEVQFRAVGGNIHHGLLFPITINFPADQGEAVTLDVTAWSAETFYGPNLIGYGGVLERLRIAIDPATNRFFFGH